MLKRQPDNLDALSLLAGIDTALGRDGDAIQSYERLLAVDPDYQEAYLYLGALYGKQGDSRPSGGNAAPVAAAQPELAACLLLSRAHPCGER